MPRALKDLVVACLLTLVGLTIGLLLADAGALAKSVDRHAKGPCMAEHVASGNAQPLACSSGLDAR